MNVSNFLFNLERMQDRNTFLAELYAKYQKRIFDFLFKYINNVEITMDLVQDTFVNFIKNYSDSDLSTEKSLMLLYTIARNNSINYSKKFSTQKETGSDVDLYSVNGTSLERKQELNDLEYHLHLCVNKLPEDQKTAFLLKNMDDLTLAQIAEIMNVSISTASRLVIKATVSLLEMAEKEGIKL